MWVGLIYQRARLASRSRDAMTIAVSAIRSGELATPAMVELVTGGRYDHPCLQIVDVAARRATASRWEWSLGVVAIGHATVSRWDW